LHEWVHPADLGTLVSLVDQAGELDQLSAAGLLDEEDLPGVLAAEGRERGHRDQRPSWLDDPGRLGEHLTAGRVEHQDRLADRVLEAFLVQGDEAVRAQVQDQGPGMASPGPDCLGASPLSQIQFWWCRRAEVLCGRRQAAGSSGWRAGRGAGQRARASLSCASSQTTRSRTAANSGEFSASSLRTYSLLRRARAVMLTRCPLSLFDAAVFSFRQQRTRGGQGASLAA
jgi:hypothetical protein